MSELSNEPTLNDRIGTLSGNTPLNDGGADGSGLGELTFDNAGPGSLPQTPQQTDPMAGLHMPTLKQNTTTTVTTNGGGPGQPQAPGQTFDGDLPQNSSGSSGSLVAFAKKFVGVPYVWGGTSPNGFDCSGFVQYVYKQMGVNLPRISADQARAGKRIGFGDLKPGDLVAVDNSSRNSGADHIGIYIGNGLVINAPRPGRSVQIDKLSAFGGGWGVRLSLPGSSGSKPRRPHSGTASKPHSY